MSRIQVQLCYNWFEKGRQDVNDDASPSCSSASTTYENIEAVMKIILVNSRIAIKEVADNVGISLSLC